jgi:ankyrin repeat protein
VPTNPPPSDANVEQRQRLSRSPHRQPVGGPLTDDAARADELLRLACLTYGADDDARPRRARELLAAHPHLARASIHTAAAIGDVDAAAGLLDRNPTEANRQGGPFGWVPLLYLTYSRLDSPDPVHDTLEVARLLLAHGADPNAGYLWEGTYPFTALTGVFGRGEGLQPPHRQAMALARLLLDAGADANDSQAIYNCGLGELATDDTGVLELLLEHGLGGGDGGPWHRLLAPDHPAPADLVQEALQHAAASGLVRRTRLLLAHGADPDRPALHPCFEGRTPYESAVVHGNADIAALLADAGADTSTVDPVWRFVGACLAGDRPAADAAIAADPTLVAQAREQAPNLVARAVETGRADAVRLTVALGFDIDAGDRSTALHEAALRGDLDLVRLLVDLGADVTIKDCEHDSTPAGWANWAGYAEVAGYLTGLEG